MRVFDRPIIDFVFQPVVDRVAPRLGFLDLTQLCGETCIVWIIVVGCWVAWVAAAIVPLVIAGIGAAFIWIWLHSIMMRLQIEVFFRRTRPFTSTPETLLFVRLIALLATIIACFNFFTTGDETYLRIFVFDCLWLATLYFASCEPSGIDKRR